MKKTVLSCLAAVLFASVGAGWFFSTLWFSSGPLSSSRLLVIPPGTGTYAIGETLSREGIVEGGPLVFSALVALGGHQGKLKAGEYEFPAAVPLSAVVDKLSRGEVYRRRITIPEGLTSFEVLALLGNAEGVVGDMALPPPGEGALLPETYDYTRGTEREELVRRMKVAMDDYVESAWPKRKVSPVLQTPKEAIILASIVEKETGIPAERARIAGVFLNRLERGMKLQTDPTVIYALTLGRPKTDGQGPLGRRLLTKDLLETDSPFNTYRYAGLPPAPISNPGKGAIEAVLQPEQHNFLYFVADGSGGHVFSETLEDHNRNVEKWRAVREKR